MCLYSSSYWKTNEKLEQKEYQSYANIPVHPTLLSLSVYCFWRTGENSSEEEEEKSRGEKEERNSATGCIAGYPEVSSPFLFQPLSFRFCLRHKGRHELLCVCCVLFLSSPMMTFRNLHVNYWNNRGEDVLFVDEGNHVTCAYWHDKKSSDAKKNNYSKLRR